MGFNEVDASQLDLQGLFNTCHMKSFSMSCSLAIPMCTLHKDGVAMATAQYSSTMESHSCCCNGSALGPT